MREGPEYFTEPTGAAQRRYEALRAYFLDEVPAAEVADRFGYSTASVHQMATLLLAKCARKPRVSHAGTLADDAGLAFVRGLTALPKTTYVGTYSWQVRRQSNQKLLSGLVNALRPLGLVTGEAGFNCDFHAIRHHGDQAVLEKQYVPRRSQRTRRPPGGEDTTSQRLRWPNQRDLQSKPGQHKGPDQWLCGLGPAVRTAGWVLCGPGGDAVGWVGYDEVLAGWEVAGERDGGGDGHPAGCGDQYGEESFGEAVGGVAAVAFGGGA